MGVFYSYLCFEKQGKQTRILMFNGKIIQNLEMSPPRLDNPTGNTKRCYHPTWGIPNYQHVGQHVALCPKRVYQVTMLAFTSFQSGDDPPSSFGGLVDCLNPSCQFPRPLSPRKKAQISEGKKKPRNSTEISHHEVCTGRIPIFSVKFLALTPKSETPQSAMAPCRRKVHQAMVPEMGHVLYHHFMMHVEPYGFV